jgi:two-component system NarL family response regulator
MRIIVADGHDLFRDGLVGLLSTQDGMEVLCAVKSEQEVIAAAFEHQPDIILMEVDLAEGSGLMATKIIATQLPRIKIMIFTTQLHDELLFTAIRSGAKGYVLKSISKQGLLTSLKALMRGEAVFPRLVMSKILEEFSRVSLAPAHSSGSIELLTYRELQVLRHLGTGASNQEIARQMVISGNTVRYYVHNILNKLKLNNRREAGALSRRLVLVDLTWINDHPRAQRDA